MEVYIYKARGKGGSIYDMSLNPYIDFEILKRLRGISNIELITDKIPISKAEAIIKKIYGGNLFGKFISLQDFYINTILKKTGIKREYKFITNGKELPNIEVIEIIEDYIKGKVITLRDLMNLDEFKNIDYDTVIDCIQMLYCERRIKYTQATLNVKNKEICFMCGKEKCQVCGFDYRDDDLILYAADNYNNLTIPSMELELAKTSQATVDTLKEVTDFVRTKKEKALILVSPKAFCIDVLCEGIYEVLKSGGRVLYVTSSKLTNEVKQELLQRINGIKIEIVLGRQSKITDAEITITSYSNYPCFYKSFDLVILDKRAIVLDFDNSRDEVYKKARKERGKFLKVSVVLNEEDKKEYKEIILMPVDGVKKPIPEPMYITSRYLDGTEEFMPNMVVEFIEFTKSKKHNMIIFLPDEKYIQRIYYILTQNYNIDGSIIDFSTSKEKEGLFRFMKQESKILISSDITDAYLSFENTNVLVMYSDSEVYTAEVLTYMCQIPSNFQGRKIGEVYFVSCQESQNMQIAKSTIRILNKTAWERGYLRK